MTQEEELLTEIEVSLQDLTQGSEMSARVLPKIDGVIVGELIGYGTCGEPLVRFDGCPGAAPIAALVVGTLSDDDVGAAVALTFAGGDLQSPIVLGRVRASIAARERATAPKTAFEVSPDGETVELQAGRQLVLRVGRASITLGSDGKVVIRGAHLVSRSSGVNRIQGGSVQIN